MGGLTAANIYALGCDAYWLLTGKPLFDGDKPMRVALHHIHAAPVPPSGRASRTIPPSLERIVLSCLEKDRERRLPSAAALSAELHSLGLERSWTESRVEQCWAQHGPSLEAGGVD